MNTLRKKVLVSNDDGLAAEGLRVLVAALADIADVTVVAPDREHSGVGGAVTLLRPTFYHRAPDIVAGVPTYAVEGTPADSVILGVRALALDTEVVVAGINQGSNLGNDVFISGTVGAAFQGFFSGLPSLALSVASLSEVHYETAARVGRRLVELLAQGLLADGGLLNVNVPNIPLDEIKGVEVTRLARRTYADVLEEGDDGRGHPFYWIKRSRPQWVMEEGTDVAAIVKRRISIAPLHSDLTSHATREELFDLPQRLAVGLLPSTNTAALSQ